MDCSCVYIEVGKIFHIYIYIYACMALELGACRCTCLQGNGISSSVWMDEQLAWYRSTLDRARQDETCGADSGFLGTVDVRRQIFLPGELGKNRERGAGGAPINM